MGRPFDLDYKFDPILNRHYHGNFGVAFHCHHYMANYTQLAVEFKTDGGPDALKEAAAEVFGEFLRIYFLQNNITESRDKIMIAEQYWKTIGMGLVKFTHSESDSLMATMEYSHVDESWLKKGKSAVEPINYVTQGFMAAVASTLNGGGSAPLKDYEVKETKSLVKGDRISEFVVTKK
jgi:hypothetical protein